MLQFEGRCREFAEVIAHEGGDAVGAGGDEFRDFQFKRRVGTEVRARGPPVDEELELMRDGFEPEEDAPHLHIGFAERKFARVPDAEEGALRRCRFREIAQNVVGNGNRAPACARLPRLFRFRMRRRSGRLRKTLPHPVEGSPLLLRCSRDAPRFQKIRGGHGFCTDRLPAQGHPAVSLRVRLRRRGKGGRTEQQAGQECVAKLVEREKVHGR